MQNQQLSDVKGKELVAAGHAFAKAIGMDTPLIEIAKMVSVLATRLDCALVRGDAHKQDVITWEKSMMAAIGEDGTGSVAKAIAELKAQRDALAAEVCAIREQAEDVYAAGYNQGHLNTVDGIAYEPGVKDEFYHSAIQVMLEVETPVTDAYLNSMRAEGVEILTGKLQQLIDEGTFDAKEIGVAAGAVHEGAQIAAQLRACKDGE